MPLQERHSLAAGGSFPTFQMFPHLHEQHQVLRKSDTFRQGGDMALCSDRPVLNSERKERAGGVSCGLSGFSITEPAAHSLWVCPSFPGQVHGVFMRCLSGLNYTALLPTRPLSIFLVGCDFSCNNVFHHRMADHGGGRVSFCDIFISQMTLRDTEWVNIPGASSNSLHLVFLSPPESLPLSQQVTQPP